MYYSYLRVSTKEQNLARQESSIKEYCSSNSIKDSEIVIFKDKASGKDFKREEYQKLKKIIRPGDTLIIKELDRLGRNSEQMKEEWGYFTKINVNIVVIDMPILNTGSKSTLEKQLIGNIVFELLAYISENERNKIKSRQLEGLEQMPVNKDGQRYSSKTGNLLGRAIVTKDNLSNDFIKTYKRLKTKSTGGTLTTEEAAAILKISRSTLNRWIKLYESEV